jgi:hypothetical protein
MNGDASLQVDEARLEEFRQTLRRNSSGRTLARHFVRQLGIGCVLFFVVLPILGGRLPARDDFTGQGAVIRVTVVLVVALLSTGISHRRLRGTLRTEITEHQRLLQQKWDRCTGPRWRFRVLRWGLLMTAGVGLPVGLLMSFIMPTVDLPGGSRVLMLVSFLGMTALWAIPMAFGIRWGVVRRYRALMGPG